MKETYRKRMFKNLVKTKLKDILHCAKKGSTEAARVYMHELDGILSYAWFVEDISYETKSRIRKIMSLIRKKYSIY